MLNKVKPLWRRLSLVTVLSLGFMILGIGCISWTMFNASMLSGHSSVSLSPGKTPQIRYISEELHEEPDPSLVKPAANEALYPVYPAEGDKIGSLTIPALEQELPIIQGTGEKELKEGVGHFILSVLPGEEDNCVFSGHRETAFRKLGNLKTGDLLIVQTSAGIFTYEVNGTRIVDEDDKTVIVPADHAVLTLTTCYPFQFVGSAPERYIVTADLLESKQTAQSN